MSNVKSIIANKTFNTSALTKEAVELSHIHVVVTIDGMTRSSIATIRKDMSEAVKRDLKVLKQFGLVAP